MLLELLTDRGKEVVGANAFRASGDLPLDGELLRSPDDILDHGARREVLEVHDFFVAVLVGDLEEPVGFVVPIHLADGVLDHGLNSLVGVASTDRFDHVGIDRQVACEVTAED